MRILLVQPDVGSGLGFRHLALVEPLGLETVAGALAGHEVRLLDLRVEGGLSETLAEFHPDVCGISCSFTIDLQRARAVAEAAKAGSDWPRPFVVVGGHHASLNPADFDSPAVDAIAVGEGERAMAELVACLERKADVRSVAGLVLNTPSGQVRTRGRPLASNLDDLPMPVRDLTRRYRSRYYLGSDRPTAMVETARGCPYRCNFCSVWHFYRGRYRVKSVERVVDEVAGIREPYILFTDDNFLVDVERARQIGLALLERGLRRRYAFQARSDAIVAHPDVVRLWRQAGLVGVFVGVEKIDDAGLSEVNKHNSVTNNERALELLSQLGVGVTASFIVDPSWERSDFSALRRYVATHRIKTPSFTVLTPLPGTVLYRQVRDRVLTQDYEIFDLLHAVLPTRLPLPEFYGELAGLYRFAYSWRQVSIEQARLLWRALSRRSFSLFHLRRIMQAARTLTSPGCYLAGHQSAR